MGDSTPTGAPQQPQCRGSLQPDRVAGCHATRMLTLPARRPPSAKDPGGRERLDQAESFLGALPKGQFPDLTAVVGELTAGRFTARFELGLGAILDRLENEAAQISNPEPQPNQPRRR
jgi:hypothetical protein